VRVADTVGAGDSLAAGLFRGLLAEEVTSRAALEAMDDDRLTALVDDAALVAALNCARVGADPPTLEELERARTAGTPAA
jgi:fructokinase